MAELIGNIVLCMVIFVVMKNFMGKSNSITTKTRQVVQSIDTTLNDQEKIRYRKSNPQRYCNSADYLSLAAICVHPESKKAREDIAMTEEYAIQLRTKLLHELAER